MSFDSLQKGVLLMQNMINIAKTYYGSWEQLLNLLHQKLDFYLHIMQIFLLLQECGLRPAYALDESHPACFTDETARYCLATYDPTEPMDCALERCLTETLHQEIRRMESADMSKVRLDGCIWEQYSLDALLRLAWRQREKGIRIPLYLKKEGADNLSDPFLLQVRDNRVSLTRCSCRRFYDTDLEGLDYETYLQHMHLFFRLATEDCGYTAPEYVWLSHRAIEKEEYHD